MTDEQLAAMHMLLAEYHRKLAKEAVLDVVQQYLTLGSASQMRPR
jgi:dimeric dUTPase (all-alpha-NTP-PPase superfamily)